MAYFIDISFASFFLTDFGDKDIQELVAHFKPLLEKSGVNADAILDQWTILKSRLYADPGVLRSVTWAEINLQLRFYCSDLLSLIDLILSIPASTADCERGFSAMKLVKTDWRASLKCETLSDLLTVQLSSAPISQFDPAPAVHLWHAGSLRSRRPSYMEKADSSEDECSDDDL